MNGGAGVRSERKAARTRRCLQWQEVHQRRRLSFAAASLTGNTGHMEVGQRSKKAKENTLLTLFAPW